MSLKNKARSANLGCFVLAMSEPKMTYKVTYVSLESFVLTATLKNNADFKNGKK